MTKQSYVPTKSDLWEELCKTRESMIAVIDRNTEVISKNTSSVESLHSVVGNTQKSLDLMVQQLLLVTNGVPMRVFLMVVGLLIIIILVLLGLDAKDMINVLAGG